MTTNIKECIFDDAIKQYLIKKKYFETYGAYDCIEKVNAELCNFFISYVDYAIIKYPKEILKKELSCYISNPYLQQASKNVSFQWFNQNDTYNAIKKKKIDDLIAIRKRQAFKTKIKREIYEILSYFL